jgi:hypothetical protein
VLRPPFFVCPAENQVGTRNSDLSVGSQREIFPLFIGPVTELKFWDPESVHISHITNYVIDPDP